MFTLYCLVDNKTLDQTCFRSEHGLAFAIQAPSGQVLFDTGQSGEVLVHNAARLGIDLSKTKALVLSHAHYDHTGGLRAFFNICRTNLPLYANPDLFRERYAIKDGVTRRVGLSMTQEELENYANLHLDAKPVQVLPKVWTTGEITERADFIGSSPHLLIQAEDGYQPDQYRDDLSLVLEAQSGLILVCGCCHAGLLNTLAHVQRIFNKDIVAIVGGSHLSNLDANTLEYAINRLRSLYQGYVPHLYLNHCTGDQALATLAQAFGDKVSPCPAGSVLVFDQERSR